VRVRLSPGEVLGPHVVAGHRHQVTANQRTVLGELRPEIDDWFLGLGHR
jgi:hypothetical protein